MKWKTILSERTILIFLILMILAVGGLILYVTFLLAYKLKWWGAVGFIIYLIILEVIYSLTKRYKFRYLQIIEKIFLFPFFILFSLFDLAKPTFYVFISFLYLIIEAFILPFSILKILNDLFSWNLLLSTMIFLIFALGSILCVHQSKIIQSLVCSLPPLKRVEHKYQEIGRDLSLYILHPRNLSFILFFLYFIYLFISGFIQLQYKSFLINEEIDGAILKAFLVFIACTNMVSKSHEIDIQAKNLLQRMLNLMDAHDDDIV